MARRIVLAAALAVSLLLAACGNSRAPGEDGSVSGSLTVFAAASLGDAFREVGAAFEDRYPGVDVRYNFAGTPTLRLQLEQGARADVFASADQAQMRIARDAGLLKSSGQTFATNYLVIITPAAHPAVDGPADLARDHLRLVLANDQVPVGAYTRRALQSMESEPAFGTGFAGRVLANVVSNESNVKQVVAKVELGEADAGIVYASDVTASVEKELKVVQLPERHNVRAEYPIALTSGSTNPIAGRAFIEFVLSAEAQAILEKHGFAPAS